MAERVKSANGSARPKSKAADGSARQSRLYEVSSRPNSKGGNGEQRKVVGNYMLGKIIGEGTFGKVQLAIHLPTGEKVAVKILEKNKIKESADVRRVNREIKILKKTRHGNIIQLYEVLDTPNSIYLIMECAEGGEMFDYIVAHKYCTELQACKFFHQILDGLEILHKNDITHRDLKPENLLLKESSMGWIVKIVDFGLSNTHEGGKLLNTACGSPCYAAPEMIAGKAYEGPLADLWSMGVILFALVCGYLPFEDPNTSALYRKIMSGDYKTPSWISVEVKDLIRKILETDPRKRFRVDDIRKHPWYCKVTEDEVPREVLSNSDSEVIRMETFNAMKEAGVDTQAALDGVASSLCNSTTAMYYLFEQKFRHQRLNQTETQNEQQNQRLLQQQVVQKQQQVLLQQQQQQQSIKQQNSGQPHRNQIRNVLTGLPATIDVHNTTTNSNGDTLHSKQKMPLQSGPNFVYQQPVSGTSNMNGQKAPPLYPNTMNGFSQQPGSNLTNYINKLPAAALLAGHQANGGAGLRPLTGGRPYQQAPVLVQHHQQQQQQQQYQNHIVNNSHGVTGIAGHPENYNLVNANTGIYRGVNLNPPLSNGQVIVPKLSFGNPIFTDNTNSNNFKQRNFNNNQNNNSNSNNFNNNNVMMGSQTSRPKTVGRIFQETPLQPVSARGNLEPSGISAMAPPVTIHAAIPVDPEILVPVSAVPDILGPFPAEAMPGGTDRPNTRRSRMRSRGGDGAAGHDSEGFGSIPSAPDQVDQPGEHFPSVGELGPINFADFQNAVDVGVLATHLKTVDIAAPMPNDVTENVKIPLAPQAPQNSMNGGGRRGKHISSGNATTTAEPTGEVQQVHTAHTTDTDGESSARDSASQNKANAQGTLKLLGG